MKTALMRVSVLALTPLAALAAEEKKPLSIIRAGRLLDVRSGEYRPGQALLIEGDRIKEIGSLEVVASHAPRETRIHDLSAYVVMPGLIDCHAHILGNPKDVSPIQGLRMSSPQATLWGYRNLQVWLSHGFTGLRDAGEADLAYGQLALRDSINAGLIRGPRIVSAGNFVSVTGGHGDEDALAPDQALPRRPNLADTVDEVAQATRHDIKYGVDWIKLMATGGVSDPMSDFNVQELSEAQMAKAVEVAHRARKKVMAHAEGTEGIKAAGRAGVDSIEHGTMLDEEGAELLGRKGIWLVPTLYAFQHGVEMGTAQGQEQVSLDKTREILKYQQPGFERALKHHLKIAYGLDDDPDFLPKEFGALVKAGMTPLGALQAATVNAAELLGLADVGSLEAGRYADVIALDGDPVKDIEAMNRVVFVMKGGDVFHEPVGGFAK
jgi:imidazolonepropionase-like amidohydrolase